MAKLLPLRTNYLYLFGLVLLVSAMPLSMYMMSMAQFVLAGAFLLEGNFIEKFRRFFRNTPAIIIVGIFLLHVVGMLWTSNYAEGWRDIRVKLPLLTLTVIIAGSEPLSQKQFKLVIGFFIAAVFAGTIISMAVLTGIIHHEVNDIRDIFIFHISHIRFALFTCIAIFSLLYFLMYESQSWFFRLLLFVLAAWLFVFLFIMDSITGIVISIAVIVFLLLKQAYVTRKISSRFVYIILAIAIPVSIYFFVRKITDTYYTAKNEIIIADAKTKEGNPYAFNLEDKDRENGYLLWVYINEDEMRKAWDERSPYNFDSLDRRKQWIKYTLMRFLTSKGYRKDGEAVHNLSEQEIHSVEKGITNVNYQNISGVRARILQIVWEFDMFMHGGEVSGHSVVQRIEFWRAARGIIKENLIAGVGTGDMPQAYRQQYSILNSKLDERHRLRAHNQYLAIGVAFGLIGLLYFLFALTAPMIMTKKYRDYFYVTFIIIALLSMISEDTLETQAGATFFAFFNIFFLMRKDEEKNLLQ
jgi:O-antigen ligase